MRYFIDENNAVFAYAADGSQDAFIPDHLIPIDEQAALALVRPAASINQLRDDAIAAIHAWRDEQEQARIVFDCHGRQWDGGLSVRSRLQPVLKVAQQAGALPEGFFWTDAGNQDVPLTLAELEQLDVAHEAALVAQGWRIHMHQRAMKMGVEALDEAQLTSFRPAW